MGTSILDALVSDWRMKRIEDAANGGDPGCDGDPTRLHEYSRAEGMWTCTRCTLSSRYSRRLPAGLFTIGVFRP